MAQRRQAKGQCNGGAAGWRNNEQRDGGECAIQEWVWGVGCAFRVGEERRELKTHR